VVPCPAGKKNDAAANGDRDAEKTDRSGIFREEEPTEEKGDDGSKCVERTEDGKVSAAKGSDHGEVADGVESTADKDVAPKGGGDGSGVEQREGERGEEHDRVSEDPGVVHSRAVEEETFLNGVRGNAQQDSK